jgi:hypothetical protein
MRSIDRVRTATYRSSAVEAGRAEQRHSGWLVFTGAFLTVVGVMNVIWGVAALSNEQYFVEGGLLWSTLNTWGWIAVVVGVIQLFGAVLVFGRHTLGQIIALVLASLGVIVHFLALGAYPVWSVIALVVNGLILWAVTVHGDEFH